MVDVRLILKESKSKGVKYTNVVLVFVDESGKVLFKTQIKPSFALTGKQFGLYNHLLNEYIKEVK